MAFWHVLRKLLPAPALLTKSSHLGLLQHRDIDRHSLRQDYRALEFLVLDLELTSLNPGDGEIISIGFVPIVKGEIIPAQGQHILISDHKGVGSSAQFHGIRDCDRSHGIPLSRALQLLDRARQGRVLVLHHAALDLGFLTSVAKQHRFVVDGRYSVIDTLHIEWHRLRRQSHKLLVDASGANELRLYQCRARYHLPNRKAHNAYVDALATAELFLAQAAHIAGPGVLTLKQLLRASKA